MTIESSSSGGGTLRAEDRERIGRSRGTLRTLTIATAIGLVVATGPHARDSFAPHEVSGGSDKQQVLSPGEWLDLLAPVLEQAEPVLDD